MAGDRGEDEAIFSSLYPALRRFAGAVRPAGADADDLVQEALTRTLALRSLATIDDPLNYLRTAMTRIASNWARGARRAAARRPVEGAPLDVVDVYPSDLEDLLRAPPRARAVLFLTVVEQHSYRDAAAIVGVSEGAARQLASRALRGLRADVRAELQPGEGT